MTDCAPLLSAVVSALRAAFPAVPTVELYPRLRTKIIAPALLVELADATEADLDPGTEEVPLVVRLELRVVLDRAPTSAGGNPDLEALALATAALSACRGAASFNVENVGPAHSFRLGPDHFRPDLANYCAWLVEWSHEVRLGSNVWDGAGVVPTEVWVGFAPEIGAAHEADYVRVGPPVAVVTGAPASPTAQTSATLTVGGVGVTHYRWRIDGGTWSFARSPVEVPIELMGRADGEHTVEVVAWDGALWQPASQATAVSWTVDTEVPVTVATPAGGTYPAAQSVTLAATHAAVTVYTVDGSEPTVPASGTTQVYSGPVAVDASLVLSYRSASPTGVLEAVHTETYEIVPPEEPPP